MMLLMFCWGLFKQCLKPRGLFFSQLVSQNFTSNLVKWPFFSTFATCFLKIKFIKKKKVTLNRLFICSLFYLNVYLFFLFLYTLHTQALSHFLLFHFLVGFSHSTNYLIHFIYKICHPSHIIYGPQLYEIHIV